MARKQKWKLHRELRDLESWLSPENTTLLRDEPRHELEHLVTNHGPHALGYIANNLSYLGLWESQAGAYSVLQGDQTGWGHLRLAFEYYSWELRIAHGEYEQDLSQGREPEVSWKHGLAARCLAQAIALRDDVFSDWCGPLMLRGANYSDGFFRDWQYTPFHPFIARLYALWRGCEIDTEEGPLRNLGIYQALLDGWNDDEQYAAALLRACDYHCTRRFSKEDEDTEFWHAPFQVFPAEILAVQRVRREQVGSAPMVSHPLLDTPLGRVPVSLPLLHDQLLQRVITRVHTELANLQTKASEAGKGNGHD